MEVELLTRSKRSVNYDWPMITSYLVTITVREMWIIILKILNDLKYIDFIYLNGGFKNEDERDHCSYDNTYAVVKFKTEKIQLTFILER